MRISKINKEGISYVSSSGLLPDKSSQYVYEVTPVLGIGDGVYENYTNGDEWKDAYGVYTRTGADISVKRYDISNTYEVGDVAWYEDASTSYLIKIVSVGTTEMAKQPRNYSTTPPSTVDFGSWGHRYAKLGVLSNNKLTFTTSGGTEHTIMYSDSLGEWGHYFKTSSDTESGFYVVDMLGLSDINVSENKAFGVISPFSDNWISRTLIRDGDTVYVRTDTDDVMETYSQSDNGVITLDRLSLNWGWTYTRSLPQYAMLDDKSYTTCTLEGDNVGNITFHSDKPFNTIAVTGAYVPGRLYVKFTPDEAMGELPYGYTYATVKGVVGKPNTFIVYVHDENDNLITIPAGTALIRGEFISSDDRYMLTKLGNVYFGMDIELGFTNLNFSTEYKDYSPVKKDQFGNILYIKGITTSKVIGSADILLDDFDDINKTVSDVAGQKVILNGTDSMNLYSPTIPSLGIFSSLMVVGRISNYKLSTSSKNNKLNSYAKYTFILMEDI